MNPHDIRSLQILEEIGNNHSSTQRGLATKLNISLGLVNSFIKRLAKKGYVKISTVPRNRLRYILTPKGFAEKSRLTYEFIQYSLHFYKKSLENLLDLLNELEAKGVEKVVFYGAGDLAEIAFISLKATEMELIGVVDDARKGQKFLDLTIASMEELGTLEFDKIIILTLEPRGDLHEKLRWREIPLEKVVTLHGQEASRVP
jgi:DNA-binding MarR family transcriptional regulator